MKMLIRFGLLCLLSLAAGSAVAAGAKWPGPYPAKLVKVLDGDTIRVLFQDGPCGMAPCPGQILSIRVRGWDAPEIHQCHGKARPSCAACPAEYQLGQEAKVHARDLLSGKALTIRNVGPDAYYGRVVASISVREGLQDEDFGTTMERAGFMERYEPGGSKGFRKTKGWCDGDKVTPDRKPG